MLSRKARVLMSTQVPPRPSVEAPLAVARQAAGSLDNVARVVKLTVFVASAEGFGDQPTIANGASDLPRDVFGDAGVGARSAVGVAELPLGASVEAEFIFELRDGV